MKNLELNELRSVEGGVEPITGAAAVAVAVGGAAAVIIVGAAVGYGVYRLVDWATS